MMQKSTVTVFKHEIDKSEKVFEQIIWSNELPHNWHKAGKMAVINNNKLYLTTYNNDFENKKI